MNNKNVFILFSIFLLFSVGNLESSELIPYVSPGIRLGWDFRKAVTLEPKISLGVVGLIPGFVNVTFGVRSAIIAVKGLTYKTNCHFDIQTGGLSPLMGKRKIQLYYGGGIGFIITNRKLLPRITLFTGNFLFTTLDISYQKTRGFDSDIGLQCIFPVPLIRFDNYSISG